MTHQWPTRLGGAAAGLANGLFGGGGGMVLLPILARWGGLTQRRLYATCVGIMDVADQLLPVLLPFLVVCIVGSALVMVVSGRVAQAAIRRERGARQ